MTTTSTKWSRRCGSIRFFGSTKSDGVIPVIDNPDVPPALHPYVEIGAKIFPLPAGTKNPTGIVGSWQRDASGDPVQIGRWANDNPGCNWGMSAAASGLIVVDIDVKRVSRDEAWTAWCDLCGCWKIPAILPTVATPSGGWHIYTRIPAGIEASDLRQPSLVPGVIDVRANGFVLIPPSKIEGKPYLAYH